MGFACQAFEILFLFCLDFCIGDLLVAFSKHEVPRAPKTQESC